MLNSKVSYQKSLKETSEIGYVKEVLPPIVLVQGLPKVSVNEIVVFENNVVGVVNTLSSNYVEILLLSAFVPKIGQKVTRTNTYLSIPVGNYLLGSSVDSLGNTIYENVFMQEPSDYKNIDSVASGISNRVKITEALETGVTSVDLMIPLGKGQRELIIGDRNIGKTTFLYQTMLSQVKKGTIVVYATIGKQRTAVKQLEEFVDKVKIRDKVVIVASSSSDPLGMIYLTPYSAMTIAEYFRDLGSDVLVVLDDLTTHGRFYREMSLIAKKFPGREAYPGDIFYAHARLLERAGLFKIGTKNVAITCLPVSETIEGDISGYIQTNLMSITDGHIFFDGDLFKQGHKPPINHFLSVTRVGRQTQSKLRWGVNRELVSFYTLYNKTQNFVHFGAELNEGIKATLQMGDKLITFFNQPVGQVVPLPIQILFYCLVWLGAFSIDDLGQITELMSKSSELYFNDKVFKQKIDKLINQDDDFNQLLGKISSDLKNTVKFLEDSNVKK